MSVTLPLESATWPYFRLLYRNSWGAGNTTGASDSAWAILPMQSVGPESTGMILLNYGRALLPQLGIATILFRYGKFGGRITGAGASSSTEQGAADPTTSLSQIPDLTDKEILIQMAPRVDTVANAVWQLVWWGTCEYQTDEGWGGASTPSGQRTYHCVEALHRLKRWPLDVHGFAGGGVILSPCKGNPGYNISQDGSDRVLGNRDTSAAEWVTQSGSTAFYHTTPGAGVEWTDDAVIRHLLSASRPPGEPLWALTGATDLFSSESAWPVQHGDTAWDLLTRIVDRSRGRGAVRCEFSQASPLGQVTPSLKAYAQINDNIAQTLPSGATTIIYGATNNGTAVEVSVIGDHRFSPDSLLLGDAQQYQVGYLETEGEPIEVVTTLSYADATLAIGWKASQETAFRALNQEKRTEDKWGDVLQHHRLPLGFDCYTANGEGGGRAHCDYRCNDAGVITTPVSSDTSPMNIQVLDDLPMFLGYDYTGTPVRYDGDAAQTFATSPPRREPKVYIKSATAKFIDLTEDGSGFSINIKTDGFVIKRAEDQGAGTRFFNAGTTGNLNSKYHYNKLVMTVGIRLPHRVRMATGDPTAKRRKVITHEGLHLWMAHQGAIWDLDTSARVIGNGSPAKRAAVPGTTPAGILRDDRDQLARRHYLAVAWYGPLERLVSGLPTDGPAHRSCSWSLRCCGDIASSTTYDGGNVIYPDVGKLVTYINANGQRIRLMTPVSSFTYDNVAGVTTWTTDWQDLDFKK